MTAQDLKNSILQLAIQGKLVEQRVEEGTAKKLLEKITDEKKRLIKEKKIKKDKPLPEITEEEIPFEIPESWEWVRLQVVAVVNGGFAFKSSNFVDDGIRVVRISDFNERGFVNNKIVRHPYNDILENYIVEEKDILLCMTGGTVGKSLFVTSLSEKMVTNQRVATIKISKQIVEEYVNYFILSPVTQNIINESKNSTNDNISMDTINSFLLPLPPIVEQKRIVEKIEELLPYIEQYDKAYSKLEVFNKKFPEDMQKSILQYAIQGKLVEQQPEEGTAEELYHQIQAEKERLIKEGKIKKEKPLSEITEDEIPFEIPESWKWVKLGDVFQVNPRNSIEDKIEVSFIPMTLLQEGYVSKFTFEIKKWGDVKKGFTHFKDNDIIFAKITPCFQNLKSAIMENLQNGYGAGTTELHVLRCYKMLSLEYFLWFVKSPYFMSFCEANMSGTAGQQRVGTDIVKNVLLPLPPLEEQKRIVNSIEEFIPYCHHLIK